ncbi:hypothetical protein BBD41_25050 [Paenibacillus ihbetae]|uniref:Uncharacterized protein n=1 Tax=Paenibacillus ihbetae TaxID=1870820 RepID=A0A1B2E6H8_9BACL|nr:hypothetical protein BBD41_25050 [Paenibacillus ihbetae]
MDFRLKLPDHLAAYVRAAAACLGTLTAVVVIMLLAFFRASHTCLDAQLAYFLNEGAVARHCLCGKGANIGTFAIQRDTIPQHRKLVFFQAGYITYVASVHTLETCFDAFFIFEFIDHGYILLVIITLCPCIKLPDTG